MSVAAVGVDVGGTKILALAVDPDGTVIATRRAATPHETTPRAGERVAESIAALLDDLATETGVAPSTVPVGVGLPGMMSREGRLAFAPNLPSASGLELADLLGELIAGVAVVCENDADCAAVAEHRLGAGRGVDDLVMVTLGTGIGGGIISEGELLRGRSGFAGEIGHMVVDARGPRCPCGGRGCWERYASGAGVARLAREAATAGRLPTLVNELGSAEAVRGEDVTRAAARGVPEALDVVDEVGWWLALGVANLAAILDVGRFVIGGGLSEVSALLVPAARRHLDGLVEASQYRGPIEIVPGTFGELAGAIGAAVIARERLA